MIQTILFDLDGTLVDTEPAAAEAILACFSGWGIRIDPTDAGYITGRTWEKAFEFLFAKYPPPVPHDEAGQRMIDSYRAALETSLTIVPGSREAVRALSAHFKIGLVSGSHRAEIFWALDKLGVREHFRVVLGAEDYPRSKPAPDGYAKALGMLGADAARTLIFEDSTAGIASARAVGAWVVAITRTNHLGHDNSQAHHHIEDLRSVSPEWVRELGKKFGA